MKFLRWFIPLFSGLLLTLGVIGGLVIMQEGAEKLLTSHGEDYALPGDQVGELEIISSRHVGVDPEAVLKILLGAGVMASGIYAARRLKPVSVQAHSEQ